MTLVSSRLISLRNYKGNIGSEGANKRGVGKIRNFQPIIRRISETVQDRTVGRSISTARNDYSEFTILLRYILFFFITRHIGLGNHNKYRHNNNKASQNA